MRGPDSILKAAARLPCAGSSLLLLKPPCRSCDRFGIGTAGERVTRCAATCRCVYAAFPVGFEQWLPPDRCSDAILCGYSCALGNNPNPCSYFVRKGPTPDFSLSATAFRTLRCMQDPARAAGGVPDRKLSCVTAGCRHVNHCAVAKWASEARGCMPAMHFAAGVPLCTRPFPPLLNDWLAPLFLGTTLPRKLRL
jgi:hypothetical protein